MAITVQTNNIVGSVKNHAFFARSAADVSVDFPAVITLTPGFVPKKVVAINVVDKLIQTWQVGMNTGDYIEEIAAGDKTLETDDLLSVNADTGVISITQAANPLVTDGDLFIVEAIG